MDQDSATQFACLTAAADYAYARARDVDGAIPMYLTDAPRMLTDRQRDVLHRLASAEAALEAFRDQRYAVLTS